MSERQMEGESRKAAPPLVAKVVIGLADPSRTRAQIAGAAGTATATRKRKPFAVLVIAAGLIFAGADLLYGISRDLMSSSAFDIFFVPLVLGFVLLCFVASLGSWMQRRWGYVLSIVVSLGFVLPSLTVLIPTASDPSNFATFSIAISSVPILVLVTVFSILCLANLKKGVSGKKYLATPKSAGGVLTVVVLLIIIGGVLGGAIARGSDSRLASSVSIVLGASNPQNVAGHYGPGIVTVVISVNNTITWTNDDISVHTVTGDSGNFDSGLLNSGDSWTHTFTTPGTYSYHCAIHPYMTGTVMVRSGVDS